jgi:hypothetical protein
VGADAGPLSVGASRHPATRTARMLRAVCSQESGVTYHSDFFLDSGVCGGWGAAAAAASPRRSSSIMD